MVLPHPPNISVKGSAFGASDESSVSSGKVVFSVTSVVCSSVSIDSLVISSVSTPSDYHTEIHNVGNRVQIRSVAFVPSYHTKPKKHSAILNKTLTYLLFVLYNQYLTTFIEKKRKIC